jgi:hypothetical protein
MLVGVVLLDVVVGHPPIVLSEYLGPVLDLPEVMICHSALNIKGAFYVRLPGLTLLDLHLADPNAR